MHLGIEINLNTNVYTLQELPEEVPRVKRKECFNTDKSDVWNRLYHVIRGKSDHVTYFQSKSKWQHSMDMKRQLGMMSCIWCYR